MNSFTLELEIETSLETVDLITAIKSAFLGGKVQIVYLNKRNVIGHEYGVHEKKPEL